MRTIEAAPVAPDIDAPAAPDIDLRTPAEPGRSMSAGRIEPRRRPAPVLAAVSAGGVLGAVARFAIGRAWPHQASGFAWDTLLVNVSGCLLIGVFMVLLTEVWTGRPLLRPFLGVGVLGGYTTFSTYIVDVQRAAIAGHIAPALAYLACTLVGAMLGVWAGSAATGWLLRTRRRGAAREAS